jgi:hypothetical protein
MANGAGVDWARWKRRGIWVALPATIVGAIWAGVTLGWVVGTDSAERPRKEQAMEMAMANRAVAARPPLDGEPSTGGQTATFALG